MGVVKVDTKSLDYSSYGAWGIDAQRDCGG